MTADAPVDRLARALEAAGVVVAGVQNDQWTNATPCAEWDVRTVLNHLVTGNRIFAAILRGDPAERIEEMRRTRETDSLGDDPLAAYRESAATLLAAFADPAVLGRTFQVTAGMVPGIVALHLRTTEALVHGWDIARGTGQPADFPEDIAEEELAFSSGPSAPNVPRSGHPFGPIQSVPEDSSAIDRLVAYLGRAVDAS